MKHEKIKKSEVTRQSMIPLDCVATLLEIPLAHLKECLLSNENIARIIFQCSDDDGTITYYIRPHDISLIKTFKNSVKTQHYITKHGTYLSTLALKEYACLENEDSLKKFVDETSDMMDFPLYLQWTKIESIYEQPPEGSYSLEIINKKMRWDIRKNGILSLYYHRILNDVQPIFADDPRYRINSNVRDDF